VLGHVLLPNASEFLSEIKTQGTTPQIASIVDEGFLRTLVGMQLGARSNLALNVDLTRPVGCAVLNPKAFEVPVVCHVDYKGGLTALLKDLGEEGKQADAQGHAARFQVGAGDQVAYLDTLGDTVILSAHPGAFAAAKGYVEQNLVGRASRVASDLELVAHVGTILAAYQAELVPILAAMEEGPPDLVAPATPGPARAMDEAFAKYQQYNTRNTVESLRGVDQLAVGFGFEPVGFVVRGAVIPASGSKLQKQLAARAGGPADAVLLAGVPASAFVVGLATASMGTVREATADELQLFSELWGSWTDKDPVKIRADFDRLLAEQAELYTGHGSFAVVPDGPVGGLLAWNALRPGKSGRESYRRWATDLTPAAILPAVARPWIDWKFEHDARTAEGVTVDRLRVLPGPKLMELLHKDEGAKALAWLKERGIAPEVVSERAELPDRVLFALSLGDPSAVTNAALAAHAGRGALDPSSGLQPILARHPAAGTVTALRADGLVEHLARLIPEVAAKRPKEPLGKDLSDLFVATRYENESLFTAELVVSQRLIDAARTFLGAEAAASAPAGAEAVEPPPAP
jgi:hypothetical protein